ALRRHRGLVSGVNPEREGWVAEVQIHRRRGDLDAAGRAVEQALGLGFAPSSTWAAGLVELDRGDVDAAAASLAALERHFAGLESRYGVEYLEHLRGEILLRRGEAGPASDAFARAVAARPLEQAPFRRALARAWLDAGDPEEASGVLYRLLEIKPDDADAHCLSADAHERAGRAEAARLEAEACRTLRAELGAAAGYRGPASAS
ncbi:MAG: tetratricopeptide repeat protein, partial [Acidobacteriota bacterium]